MVALFRSTKAGKGGGGAGRRGRTSTTLRLALRRLSLGFALQISDVVLGPLAPHRTAPHRSHATGAAARV